MARFHVHIHTGSENQTEATPSCLVALTALREGHALSLFLAEDAVHLLSAAHRNLTGQETGCLGDHPEGLASLDAQFHRSDMSAKAHGDDESLLEGYRTEFVMPDRLVALAAEPDTVLCY